MTNQKNYIGPVIYVVHSPMEPNKNLPPRENEKRKLTNQELYSALDLAIAQKIPIVLEPSDEAQKKFAQSIKEQNSNSQIEIINPKIVGEIERMRNFFTKANIYPTAIFGIGAKREICLTTGLKIMRKVFPYAELYLVKKGSLSLGLSRLTHNFLQQLRESRIKRIKRLDASHLKAKVLHKK